MSFDETYFTHVVHVDRSKKTAFNDGLKNRFQLASSHSEAASRFYDFSWMEPNRQCYFSLGHITRTRSATGRSCLGKISLYSGRSAREHGFSVGVALCLAHAKFRRDQFHHCAFLFDHDRCTGPFRACPERLQPVLDDITGQVSAYVCRKHKNDIDSCVRITEHPKYQPPPQRASVLESMPIGQDTTTENVPRLLTLTEAALKSTQNELNKALQDLETSRHRIQELENENKALHEELSRTQKTTFSSLLESFHSAILKHHGMEERKLYSPESMIAFCNVHAPGLFSLLEDCITSNYSSQHENERRAELRRQRVVAELYRLAYFRNQKITPFVNDVGLHLSLSGCSKVALECGRALGVCDHPKSIQRYKKKLAKDNEYLVEGFIDSALAENRLAILVIDDFHSIHTIPRPTSSKTSTAVHLATCIIDAPSAVPSFPVPEMSAHYWPSTDTCKGAINTGRVADHFEVHLRACCHETWLTSLPPSFHNLDTQDIVKSLENLRCYSTPNVKDLDTLRSTRLVDEHHQGLKCLKDYQMVIEKAIDTHPALKRYLESNLVPSLGDYPTYYFQKKIIAQNPNDKMFQSILPILGPFHIYLNSVENLYSLYHPIFEGLFKAVFGQKKNLPKKPSHPRMATLLTALLTGWLVIRPKILEMFGICKDIEYLMLRHLLEELVPLVFFFYATIHRGSNFQLWQASMINLTIMFITQQRHNYNKAMLATISDCLHYETIIPEWKSTFSIFMNVFTEKKVEIFHSLLRMQCPN
eukprot:m.253168 g.253168  ORF g.253168 m.253168 type:complete len:759 (+) comp40368_c2_seq5:2568-4844(+)